MKRFGWFFGLALGTSVFLSGHLVAGHSCCALDAIAASKTADKQTREAAVPTEHTVVFRVDGMTCGGCAAGVEGTLVELPGVSKAAVTYETSRAVLRIVDEKISTDKILEAINSTGYKGTFIPTEDICVHVKGMTSEESGVLLEAKMSAVEGIYQALANQPKGVLCVTRVLDKVTDDELLEAVQQAGGEQFEFIPKVVAHAEPATSNITKSEGSNE